MCKSGGWLRERDTGIRRERSCSTVLLCDRTLFKTLNQ